MFLLYFKEYSEKVWGIECEKISQDWVATRIEGLSLGVAIKNAFFNQSSKNIKTLADTFIYPSHGIGQISDRLMEEIDKENSVLTSTGVSRIHHNNHKITGIDAVNCDRTHAITGNEFVSSIPITNLVSLLNPAPPAEVMHAVSKLRYRDVVIASVMLNRERVTDLTWMYLPEKSMELGRIHEPRNWSPHMAPEGKTHIVAEYFCFQGDRTWNSTDEELTEATVKQLERLGFVQKHDVIDSCVVRVPRAYPLFEVGYSNHYSRILDYLEQFTNLHVAGRTGMFKYYNMDRAIESGIEVAENILKRNQAGTKTLLAGV
jgi:protoporphyrinogen oxidase